MSMHQGLDLSKFKKVSSDKQSSTLRHAKGHEIKIAHKGISPKMREALDGLPMHLAEGGEIDDDPSVGADTEVAGNDDPSVAVDTQETPEAPEASPPQAPLAPTGPVETPPPAPAPPPKPTVMPEAGTVNVVGKRPAPPPPPEPADEMNKEDALLADDMAKGHIKPETYQSLYGKEDTLGKLGTLFGLLISGAGSGLAHQPNAVMDMMNKEIERDLDAQKSSASNVQNWHKLMMQHEINKSDIARKQWENVASAASVQESLANAYSTATSADLTRFRIQNLSTPPGKTAVADMTASTRAKNAMLLGAGNYFQSIVNKLPPGANKEVAQAKLDTQIRPAITQEVMKNNQKTGAAMKLSAAAEAKKAPPPKTKDDQTEGSGVDDAKILQMQQRGAQAAEMGMVDKNGIMPSDMGKVNEESGAVKLNRASYKSYVDSFKNIDHAFLKSGINPGLYNAEVGNFETSLAKQVGSTEAHKAVLGMFPDMKDWGKSKSEKFRKTTEHFQINEANTPTLDKYGLKQPFQAAEMDDIVKGKDGKSYKRKTIGKKTYMVPVETTTAQSGAK